MYCSKCGTELPDDANFCPRCGHSRKPNAHEEPGETTYEFCALEVAQATVFTVRFLAKANGRVIDQSDKCNPAKGETKHANGVLVARLASQGWEPVTHDRLGRVVLMRPPKRR